MLRLYDDIRIMQREVAQVVRQIQLHDADLAKQLRRACQSVALGVAEGMGATAGNRRLAYERALKEARECCGALHTAQDWQYISEPNTETLDRLDKIKATLYRLTHPR